MSVSRDTVADVPKSVEAKKTDRAGLALLCMGHLFDDISQGALPVMLPFFIAAYDLSYSAAAGLVLALTVGSSVLQPLFGQYSDRHAAPWLVPGGLFLAGAGVALSGLMPSYALIVAAICISGIGIAAFHPEASRFANYASGARRATGMSIFSLGGNLGFAIGPMLATPLLLAFGLQGGLFLVVPVAIMAPIIAWQLPRFHRPAPNGSGKLGIAPIIRPDSWGPFARLTGVVIVRSIIFYGLNTFIPLYWRDDLHQPLAAGSAALTILFLSGSVGTLSGGWLADRYGRRKIVMIAMGLLFALLGVFVLTHDPAIGTLLLVPIGLAMFAPMSVLVVMGQEYLPNRIGTASGVTMGLAVSIGGLAAPLMGSIADSQGIHAVLTLLVAVPLVGLIFTWTLPKQEHAI